MTDDRDAIAPADEAPAAPPAEPGERRDELPADPSAGPVGPGELRDELPADPSAGPVGPGELRDELPADLDITGFVGPYKFPDNSRRRIPGVIYLTIAIFLVVIWYATRNQDPVLVNDGYLIAAGLLGFAALMSITSGWRMHVDERDALVAATTAVGFPVGHASAQLAWRGARSRPTWRILCYSAEDPPRKRGFVLIDAIDARVVSQLVEDNPEEWAQPAASQPAAS